MKAKACMLEILQSGVLQRRWDQATKLNCKGEEIKSPSQMPKSKDWEGGSDRGWIPLHTHTPSPSDSLDCQPQIQLIVIESWRVSIHKYLRLRNAEVLKPLWQYRPVFTMYNWAVSFLGFYWDFIEKETRGNKLFHNNYLAMFRCSTSGKQCESMPGMFVYVWGKEALMQKLFMCRRPAACVTWATFEKRNPAIQISKIFHSMLTAGISV